MSNPHSELGNIAETVLAAGDVIKQSFDPSEEGISAMGYVIDHQGMELRVIRTEGSRYELRYVYRFSDVLENVYTDQILIERAGLSNPTQEDYAEAFRQCLIEDLRGIDQKQQQLSEEILDQLGYVSTNEMYLSFKNEDEELWNGVVFTDYLYPATDSYSVQEYRDAVRRVYRDGSQAARILTEELDEIPEGTEEASPRSMEGNGSLRGFQ